MIPPHGRRDDAQSDVEADSEASGQLYAGIRQGTLIDDGHVHGHLLAIVVQAETRKVVVEANLPLVSAWRPHWAGRMDAQLRMSERIDVRENATLTWEERDSCAVQAWQDCTLIETLLNRPLVLQAAQRAY